MKPTLILEWAFRLVLAGAFLKAGYEKAHDPIQFLFDIRSFHLVPDPYPGLISLGLPWLELLCSVGVLGPIVLVRKPLILAMNLILIGAWCGYLGMPGVAIVLIVGAALLSGDRLSAGSLAILAGSLAIFMGAIAWSWHRGLDVSCGCFGQSDFELTYTQHLLMNATLLGMALWLLWQETRARRPQSPA